MAYYHGHDSRRVARPSRANNRVHAGRNAKSSPPRNSSKKRKVKNSSGGIFSASIVVAIFFLFVFVYIGNAIRVFWTPGIETMIVRTNTVSDPQSLTGIIIRNEQVVYAERNGQLEFWVHEHERVAVGTLVASVLNPGMAGAAIERLNAIEDQAIEAQSRRHVTDSTVQSINNNLGNMVYARAHNFATMSLSEIYSLRDNVNQLIGTRNQISISDGVAARDSLQREQVRHATALQYNLQNMYAPYSGIMSRLIDGLEGDLTRDFIDSLTRDSLRELVEYTATTPAQSVDEGDAAFKIVGNNWYIAVEIPTEDVIFEKGATRLVYLFNPTIGAYESHSLVVQRIDYGTRYSLVVFRSTRHVTDFMCQRNISIRISSGIESGLLVPDSAIAVRRHFRIPEVYVYGVLESYVVLSVDGENIPLAVTVESTANGYSYIQQTSGLSIGSLLVPRTSGMSHLLLSSDHAHELTGVYMERFGVATFRAINIGTNVRDGGYLLLDPSLGQGINEFAHIVTDASTVTEGQLLR